MAAPAPLLETRQAKSVMLLASKLAMQAALAVGVRVRLQDSRCDQKALNTGACQINNINTVPVQDSPGINQ